MPESQSLYFSLSLSLHPTGSATRLLKAEGRPPNVQHQSQRPCSLKLRCEFSLAPVLCPNLDWAVFQKHSLRFLHINSSELQRETFTSERPSALDFWAWGEVTLHFNHAKSLQPRKKGGKRTLHFCTFKIKCIIKELITAESKCLKLTHFTF